ncbi:MAG: T9SS type A sorting domain-containing protein, partial [Bacteroidota bacterium]
VVPQENPDANEKFINDVSIVFEKEGINGISQYYQQILNVATQCPYIGGTAVYRARPYVTMFNDTIEYNDDDLCEQHGIYRVAQDKNTEIKNRDILIIPNPANDIAEIILQGDYEGICKIKVEDIIGRIIKINTFDCKRKRNIISTSGFAPGIYQINVIINNDYIKTAKLVIVR